VDDSLRSRIIGGEAIDDIRRRAAGLVTGTLRDDACEKVRLGLTTPEEAIRVLFDYPPRLSSPAAPPKSGQ